MSTMACRTMVFVGQFIRDAEMELIDLCLALSPESKAQTDPLCRAIENMYRTAASNLLMWISREHAEDTG